MTIQFNSQSALPTRFLNHARLGLQSKVKISGEASYQHKPNLVEKLGNGVLTIVGSLPRSVKWVARQFQDPRVVTVALAALALFVATISFYPTATIAGLTTAYIAIKALIISIPLWSVKLAAYILTCSTIVGFGLRASGRFANESLMKAFYGLPQDFQGNPSYLTINQIRAMQKDLIHSGAEPQETSEAKEQKSSKVVAIDSANGVDGTDEIDTSESVEIIIVPDSEAASTNS